MYWLKGYIFLILVQTYLLTGMCTGTRVSKITVFFSTVRTTHTRTGTEIWTRIFIVPRTVPKMPVHGGTADF